MKRVLHVLAVASLALCGAVVVVATGLFTFWREQRLIRQGRHGHA